MNDFLSNYRRVLNDFGESHGDKIYFRCPFPACAASKSRKFTVDPERGWWNCFRCRQTVPGKLYRSESSMAAGGTAKEFAELIGDDPALWPDAPVDGVTGVKATGAKKAPAPVKKLWTELFTRCHLHPHDAALLAARGIDPAAAGLVSIEPEALDWVGSEFGETAMLEAGLLYEREPGEWKPRTCVQPGRVLIPYFNEKQEVEYFVGYRRLPSRVPTESDHDFDLRSGRWVKVAGPAGFTPLIYGTVPPGSSHLLVTEGQIKALAAIQRGVPMVGLQGMGNGHPALVRQAKQSGVRRVLICFDSSREDQDVIQEEEERLARLIEKAGMEAAVLRLPLDPAVDGGEKMDVDSFLLQFGLAEFARYVGEARGLEQVRMRPKVEESPQVMEPGE